MIHIFHGFLGRPEDFSFLDGEGVTLHDIYDLELAPQIGPQDILIGYSMGGRIALDIAERINYQFKKIVLINSHPGLSREKDRQNRKQFEVSILQSLKTTPVDEFIKAWNALPIFLFDAPIEMRDEVRFRKSAEVFNHYRLSNQDNHLPSIEKNKEKVLWIIGTLDEKYMDLSRETLAPLGISVRYVEGGHRLFQKPEQLKKILQEEHIL